MRRGAIAGLVVMLGLALGGCVGIPMSGPVQAGGLIDPEPDLDFGFLPSGPQPGADQSSILSGFIQAATSPKDNYEIARQFLSDDIRDEWSPNAITQIRAGNGAQSRTSDTSLNYTFSTSAYVDGAGRYWEDDPATTTLPFSFEQNEDGEWRISAAVDGTVLNNDGFTNIFNQRPLYFYDPTGRYLVPDIRWFPNTALIATREVAALLAGQSSWLGKGVTNSFFPANTKVVAVVIEAGTATVDLSDEAAEASPQERAAMREQLKSTIGVADVTITVNGVAIEVPDPEVIPVIDPTPASALLVRVEDEFGYLALDESVTNLTGQGAEIVELGATDSTLSRGRDLSAVLAPDGVHIVYSDNTPALLVDSRPGLLAPSTDASDFVWSIPADDGSAILVVNRDGEATAVSSTIPAGTDVVSFSISRDGTRALFYVTTDVGPELFVAGILRSDGVPTALSGDWLPLRVNQSTQPLDAAWVDDHTVATLALEPGSGFSVVTTFDLGGSSTSLGRIFGGVAMVGGAGHSDGLRVRNADGEVFLPRGSGWATTDAVVTYIATQQ